MLNLPPKLDSQGLRNEFSTLGHEITDARVLYTAYNQQTSRRVGFVGFRREEDAQKALEWFNGAWLGSGRIKVEIAKSVGYSSFLAAYHNPNDDIVCNRLMNNRLRRNASDGSSIMMANQIQLN